MTTNETRLGEMMLNFCSMCIDQNPFIHPLGSIGFCNICSIKELQNNQIYSYIKIAKLT